MRRRIWRPKLRCSVNPHGKQNDELSRRWINQIHKEALISEILGLPPETAAAIANDIKVLINKQIAKEMGKNG